jgi:hypothetical protein
MAGKRTTFWSDMRTRSHTNSPWNAPSPFTTDQLENSINNRPILLNVRNFEKGGVSKVTSGMDGHFWFRSHDVRAAAVASGDRSQFLPSPANRAYTVCLYYCPTSSISAIFRPKTMHVHNTWISYVNKSVSVAGFSGFVCIINNQILRKHTAILVCPVQGKQCVHLKFSDNFCTKNY